ncbi:MAG TPA: hypothetical protein VJA66_09330 [Thermoanaerobaculia bacterium]
MKSSERKEKSAVQRIAALVGSFAAGAVLTWTIGAATANTARSEESLVARSVQSAAVEQAGYVDQGSNDQRITGHSECDLQLD